MTTNKDCLIYMRTSTLTNKDGDSVHRTESENLQVTPHLILHKLDTPPQSSPILVKYTSSTKVYKS